MRKLQNIISTLGNEIIRQGNSLIVRVEALRSLCASLSSALYSSASSLVIKLRDDAWQGPCFTWLHQPVGTVAGFVTVVTTPDQRRHAMIMCHRAAA